LEKYWLCELVLKTAAGVLELSFGGHITEQRSAGWVDTAASMQQRRHTKS
jgi:hypothetical protein